MTNTPALLTSVVAISARALITPVIWLFFNSVWSARAWASRPFVMTVPFMTAPFFMAAVFMGAMALEKNGAGGGACNRLML